jgi:uncharacterized protein YcbK (DUF882 family)
MRGNLTCPDKCGFEFNTQFLRDLTELDKLSKIYIKREIYITSGPRCPEYNAKVKGINGSTHTEGIAADIEFLNSEDLYFLIKHSLGLGICRIGINREHKYIHIDKGMKSKRFDKNIIWLY